MTKKEFLKMVKDEFKKRAGHEDLKIVDCDYFKDEALFTMSTIIAISKNHVVYKYTAWLDAFGNFDIIFDKVLA